jgi:ribosomal-protein-alanine N-acetyltransferase
LWGEDMQLNSQRIYIRKLQREDIKHLFDLRIRNHQFLQPFEPLNQDSNVDKLIGRVNLSNIVLGAWESCTIGYYLDEQF